MKSILHHLLPTWCGVFSKEKRHSLKENVSGFAPERFKTNKNELYFSPLFAILFFSLLGFLQTSYSQTTLAAGDIAIVGFNSANPDQIAVVLLKDIATGTIFNFTDNGFTAAATGRTGEGFLTFTAPGPLTAGTVLTWANGQVITGTGWSSNNPTNFALNGSGDQLFIFQGSTANWATQSGITLLYGGNFVAALSATSSASNTVQPSALTGNNFISLTGATFANTYFANGTLATVSVAVTDTQANLLALISSPAKWFGNGASAATFPAFNISLSGPKITVTGTPLSAVNTTYGTASASPTTFTISGTQLSTNNLVITAPSGFELSKTVGGASGYATSQTIIPASGTVANTTIYVRLAQTTVIGSYSGNISCISAPATQVNVATISSAVTAKTITISGAIAANKIYNRTTAATISGATANGIVNGDVIAVSGGGTFNNFNVGIAKPVIAALVLTGANASSYFIAQPSGLTATILPKDLTIGSAVANNKVYDGNTNATLSGALNGVIVSDDVTLNASASFDTFLVGTAIPVISFSTLAGADVANYNLIQPSGLSANITLKPLTIAGAIAANKVFDGNTTASLSGTLTGVVVPDDVSLILSGNFASAAVGVNIPVTSASSLTGADTANYSLTQPTGLTANISAATLLTQTITFNSLADVTYGSADFNLTATSDAGLVVTYVSSDPSVVTIVAGTVAGTYKVHLVSAGFSTITASQSGNATYDAANPVDQLLNVTPKELTASATASNKVYDGNDTVIVSGSLNGVVGTDIVVFNGSGIFTATTVGTAISVLSTATLSGANAANYTLTQPALTADITPLALTVIGASAANKTYNGNTNAIITGSILQGVIVPDVVTISGGGAFASAAAGTGIAVTSNLTLSGFDAGNYTILHPGGLTANITALALTISGLSGVNKIYDRTTAANLSGTALLNGVVVPDDVTLTGTPIASFSNKTVGIAKPLTVTGYTLSGLQAGNYTITPPAALTANITPFSLTVFGAAAASKPFDGNTIATISGTLVGTLGTDVVSLIGTGNFATSAIGNGIAVTSSATVGGTDGANYIVNPQPAGLTANIFTAPSLLASQDFEVIPATPTLTFTTTDISTPGASTGFTSGQTGNSSTDAPSAVNLFSGGARGYRVQGPATGSLNTARVFTFNTVDASAYSNIQASFRIAGMSLGSTGNGMDGATGTTLLGATTPLDFALLEVSPDGGTTWYKQAIVNIASANSNVRWSFAPTGTGTKVYAGNDLYSSLTTTGTGTITTGTTAITTAAVTSLPSVSNLRMRITLQCNSVNESWILDDVQLSGVAGPPCTTPDPITALSATNGSGQSVVNWNYGSCYDEALVVASTAGFTSAVPAGNGTAYIVNSQNFADAANSTFDGGKAVYKGSLSNITVTSLTNGTPYNFKVFVRKGTNWTVGSTATATPAEAFYYWDGDGATTSATGGNGTWDNAATSNWRTPTSTGALAAWVTNTAPLNAILDGTAGTIAIAAGTTFTNTSTNLFVNTNGYTLATGSGTIVLPALNSVLGNGVNLTLAANVNTTTPANGTLSVGNISGPATAGITIAAAQNALVVAQRINLSRTNSSITVPVTITSAGGSGTATIAGIVATATGTTLSIAATITNNTALKTGLGATSGSDITANGLISGSADLMFAAGTSGGAGTVTLNAANTYAGATLFNAATSGRIRLGTVNALPVATNVTMGYSLSNGGILDLNGFNQTVGSLSSGAGGGSILNNGVATDATLTINGALSTAFGLAITDGTSKVALSKAGAGTLILSSVLNSYTGGTTISGGKLQLGNAGVLANSGKITLSGGALDTAGFSETVGTLNVTSTGSIILGSANHTLTLNNSSAIAWTGTALTINGWAGVAGQANASGGKIQVGAGGFTPAQLAIISFAGFNGTPIILASGELVPNGPVLAITSGAVNHGNACLNTAAAFIDYTITNTGTTASGVTVVSNNTEFVVSNAPTTISGGGTAAYRITFTPTAAGIRNAVITIATVSPSNNGPITSSVSGTGVANTIYYADTDNDMFGDLANPVVSCTGQPALTATNSTDCNPSDGTAWRLDNFYTDADNDGYNNGAPTVSLCYGSTAPSGFTLTNIGTDCNDANFEINANHVEVLGNGIDDNCDGVTDEVAPTTSLQPNQCGVTISNIATALYANQVSGALGYRFEVTNGANVRRYDSAASSFNLLNLAGGVTYATTYSIRVAVKTAPGFWRAYSASCDVTTPAVPDFTSVIPSQCGVTFTSISNTIYCDQVTAANQYRFEVSDGVTTRTFDTAVNRFNLTNLAGGATYATTYSIRVALRYGSVYQDFGPSCNVTTPLTPGTSNVTPSQCGITISNSWTIIYATQVPEAAGYRFEVVNGASTRFFDTPNARFNLYNLAGAPPAASTTYTIRVAILFNSIYQPFGSVCTVTTAGSITRNAAATFAVFAVKAFPNPVITAFQLNLNSSSEEPAIVRVYDMLGRTVETFQVPVAELSTMEIGHQYRSGVYNVTVSQGDDVKTIRVIKR